MSSDGRSITKPNAISGIRNCFTAIVKYTLRSVNTRPISIVPRRIPITIIESGVAILAVYSIIELSSGKKSIPVIKISSAAAVPIIAGLRNIFLTVMYFVSCEIIAEPTVHPRTFMTTA